MRSVPFRHRELERRVVLVDLEAEVGADPRARLTAGATRLEARVAVAAAVDVVGGHLEHPGRARVDAQVAALARFDVDDDGAARADGRHAATSLHAGTSPCGTASRPARMASTLRATCCTRYDGNDDATAASSASRPTTCVIAVYAPSITIDAVMMLPSSTAMSVA